MSSTDWSVHRDRAQMNVPGGQVREDGEGTQWDRDRKLFIGDRNSLKLGGGDGCATS